MADIAETLIENDNGLNSSQSQNEMNGIWGKLIPYDRSFEVIDLIGEEPITIGRNLNCSRVFTDRRISTNHCSIFKKPEPNNPNHILIYIKDTSTNGTFINNNKLKKGQQTVLYDSDQISLGSFSGSHIPPVVTYAFRNFLEKKKPIEQSGIHQFYDIRDKILGIGQFATVKEGTEKSTGKQYAIKIIDKNKFILTICFV
ncbi:serine/threonine-protein kinase fhke-related [Anaeramoeba ignava]|uniref:Serine/threonine-protein kinase fhke-related n=1 Tax=Anaeramoeba ignava TaxID=1746090 RepID=A0A9Q0RHH6_ANAIG|nr:serine/threonine-protein kinase fhke-related [Anaeramoeba ignava]